MGDTRMNGTEVRSISPDISLGSLGIFRNVQNIPTLLEGRLKGDKENNVKEAEAYEEIKTTTK